VYYAGKTSALKTQICVIRLAQL